MADKRPNVIRVRDREPEQSFSHPLNPASEVRGVSLSEAAGLSRLGVHLFRIPPGRESFAYHSHMTEEEWIYVLSGRGIAEVDGVEHELGPGDFLGFPVPSVAHHLRNPFGEELVYLSGGERHAAEVADFPRLGKRMVRVGMQVAVYPLEAGEQPFPGLTRL